MIFGRLESAYVESRYKLLTVADRRFILDLDSHPLFPLFPFLVLIILVKAIEIDDRDTIYAGPTSMSKFFMLLISISIKTLSKLLKNYSLSNLNSVEKRLLILATVVLILTVRYYFKMKDDSLGLHQIIDKRLA